ncbi:MAG: hypothetical protein JZU67_06780 [Burkholderiaceae bacterium]|jgi:hypothetical protein|nr:hypothetical protein [Burkholderiaceae bacterium]
MLKFVLIHHHFIYLGEQAEGSKVIRNKEYTINKAATLIIVSAGIYPYIAAIRQ